VTESAVQLVTSERLPYLLARARDSGAAVAPVLCFLHGFDEGAPAEPREALTRHGPLRSDSSPLAAQFIVVAPQLPEQGDVWHRYAAAVHDIMKQVQARYGGDPERTFLTGFSFGGNGVFDLALAQRRFWAALWPVDPTRAPRADPPGPVWLSSGAVSRRGKRTFVTRLHLVAESESEGDRVYRDDGHDHVGTALSAYQADRVYRWLLGRRRKT
jgi:poly(3-hydroxybutyrate) depolymerase